MLRYENQLKKQPYLTGNQISFVDIVVFIEIETVLLMHHCQLPKSCQQLLRWQNLLRREPALMSVNQEFINLQQDWDLYAPGH